MDFWDQQALMESDNDYQKITKNIIRSIHYLQESITNTIHRYNRFHKMRITYDKPRATEIYKNLLSRKFSSTILFSINEISGDATDKNENELYGDIAGILKRFNVSEKYLYAQGNNGDYTIKGTDEFYRYFNRFIKNESSIDFFEEEAIRLNEGLIKYIKDKKQAKEAIKNNKQNIIKSISKALKDLEKYFSKLSIEVKPAESVYNGMLKNAKLNTQCGSISFTKSGVSKAEIFRQTSAFKQYCKQNKFKISLYRIL